MVKGRRLQLFMFFVSFTSATAFAQGGYSISENGLNFIAEYEGIRYDLYNDPAGHCTIGVGHLVHTGNCDGSNPREQEFLGGITDDQARELLRADVAIAEQEVNSQVSVPLTQAQFDALVSFTYNLGGGYLATMLSDSGLNGGNYDAVPTELDRYVYGGGIVLPGLITRRCDEGTLFRSDGNDFFTLKWDNNDHYYQVSERTMNWEDAKAYAETRQITDPDSGVVYRGHLATITSSEENSWVFQNVISSLNVKGGIWLGGYQDDRDTSSPSNGWHWTTGEPWSWTNWDTDEPNDADNTSEQYLEMWLSNFGSHKGGMWNDEPLKGYHGNTKYLLIEYVPITSFD